MDPIAAINGRIAEIQGRIASLAPPRLPAAHASTSSFAAVLAAQLAAPGPSAPASASAAPAPPRVGSFGPTQLANAAAIIQAGQAMGLSVRDQTIGVMTAIGESSLQVLDGGDTAGPDSRGLFQQRANGAWGSLAERMDPTASATRFFTALSRVEARDSMSPTAVAHEVQRNADPQHYSRYWDDAVAIVTAVRGTTR